MIEPNNYKRIRRTIEAKPFVKWAGGKGHLLTQLGAHLPVDFDKQENLTYIEPFVGGGAMLFHMLTHFPNIRKAVINDINADLILCYQFIKCKPEILIEQLNRIEIEYYHLDTIDEKGVFYYQMRDRYNNQIRNDAERAACFIFLNKTCFNGLYRVNSNGKFNVPFGKYRKPTICDEELIMVDHDILKNVDIYTDNYYSVQKYLGEGRNYIYIDPPYRPLSGTAYFKQYSRNVFDDQEQEKLKVFCDELTAPSHTDRETPLMQMEQFLSTVVRVLAVRHAYVHIRHYLSDAQAHETNTFHHVLSAHRKSVLPPFYNGSLSSDYVTS